MVGWWKWFSELAFYWFGWQVLDLLRATAGIAMVTGVGWLWTSYKNSRTQREWRGAFMALVFLTIFLALSHRPPNEQVTSGRVLGHVDNIDTGEVVTGPAQSSTPAPQATPAVRVPTFDQTIELMAIFHQAAEITASNYREYLDAWHSKNPQSTPSVNNGFFVRPLVPPIVLNSCSIIVVTGPQPNRFRDVLSIISQKTGCPIGDLSSPAPDLTNVDATPTPIQTPPNYIVLRAPHYTDVNPNPKIILVDSTN
jgi:hypothetical protein